MQPELDPLTGRSVVIVADRQDRPNLPPAGCPFCVGGLEAPEPYDVRTIVNRWPPMPDDRCEVVLYTSDHDATFGTLSPAAATRVVETWVARTEALGSRPDVGYVLIFENRGPEVGATISHPHGQIYAFADVPEAAGRELDGDCALCREPTPDELVVNEFGEWQAWVPAAAEWPFELRMAPTRHAGTLAETAAADLGSLLVDALGRLDRLFTPDPMPYMLWVHQRPTDRGDWPAAHVHLHVAPILRAPGTPRYVAAGELGSGVFFNPVTPADAAARLRAS
jgi:UDPglucose--hexose-1-phosphate uridylyltransferase